MSVRMSLVTCAAVIAVRHTTTKEMNKALREMQTLRAGCKAGTKKLSPRRSADPLPGARDGQNLIS